MFRRRHGALIGLGRRQVVTYRTKKVVTYRTKKVVMYRTKKVVMYRTKKVVMYRTKKVVMYRTKKVVMYRTKKERRGTENRTKAWTYIYMPKIQILQKFPCAHTIYP